MPQELTARAPEGQTGRLRELVLVCDIGSTTTKAMLLERTDAGFRIRTEASSPTTVEAPLEDVRIGVRRAVETVEELAGEELLDDTGKPSVSFLATSSAGGGLQILVFGLTRLDTGAAAEMAAQGAGGVILRTVTIDDEKPPVENMRLIHLLHPDMVLMAGGIDGGAIGGVVHMAELLSLARPMPKFGTDSVMPLVFCGNVEARPFISQLLGEEFDLHITDNLRPDMVTIRTGPAQREIHRLFMENVMERAPGYRDLKEAVCADILPTPAAVQRILEVHEQSRNERAAMMDMGGATTDIFTSMGSGVSRSVAANTGMSYSICNIMATAGVSRILRHLPDRFEEDEARDYVASKMLRPTSLPQSADEKLLEQAVAVEGASEAWRQHREMWYRQSRIGFLDRLKLYLTYADKFRHHFFGAREGELDTRELDLLVGTGGVVTETEDPLRQLWMLAEGFKPAGITRLAVETHFRSPHLGVLATVDEATAAGLFAESLREVGYLVAPTGVWINPRIRAISIVDRSTGRKMELNWGRVVLLPQGGDLEISAGIMAEISGGPKARLKTELPVLLDCRGRGRNALDQPLAQSLGLTDREEDGRFKQRVAPPGCSVEEGEFSHLARLPYQGEISVSDGDIVEAGQVVGENSFAPPRLYIVDLRKETGWRKSFPPEALRDGLKVSEGDVVSLGQKVFEYRDRDSGGRFLTRSPVRGRVTGVESTGLLILREIQDYDGKPHRIDVAGPLKIRPRKIRGWLKKHPGDFVSAGEAVAADVTKGIFVRAPSSGILKEIDRQAGTVTIQYDVKPVPMRSIVSGAVTSIEDGWSATISYTGQRLTCAIGFGPESCGRLVLEWVDGLPRNGSGLVAAFDRSLSAEDLESLAQAGFQGVIAPSIRNSQWVHFHGRELGVALTGDEEIPFGLVLTEGFGTHGASNTARNFLARWSGSSVGLATRTQIRAGVTRPSVLASG